MSQREEEEEEEERAEEEEERRHLKGVCAVLVKRMWNGKQG